MSLPDLVILDLDGTVADSLPATFAAFADAVEPVLGRRPSQAEFRRSFGPPDHEIVSDWVGGEHAQAAVARLYAAYEERFAACRPFPGMVEVLESLAGAGKTLALFTGRGRPSTDRLLAALELSDRFEATVAGDEVPRSKPAPDGLLKLLDDLSTPPERAVYVGDTRMDVAAARAAGVRPVAALWGAVAGEFAGSQVDTAGAPRDLLVILGL